MIGRKAGIAWDDFVDAVPSILRTSLIWGAVAAGITAAYAWWRRMGRRPVVIAAVAGLSVGLIWGFCGILSLGHGAFFALGGYCMGMYLMRQIGTRGVYGNPLLPDFMVFLNYKELPMKRARHTPILLALLLALCAVASAQTESLRSFEPSGWPETRAGRAGASPSWSSLHRSSRNSTSA